MQRGHQAEITRYIYDTKIVGRGIRLSCKIRIMLTIGSLSFIFSWKMIKLTPIPQLASTLTKLDIKKLHVFIFKLVRKSNLAVLFIANIFVMAGSWSMFNCYTIMFFAGSWSVLWIVETCMQQVRIFFFFQISWVVICFNLYMYRTLSHKVCSQASTCNYNHSVETSTENHTMVRVTNGRRRNQRIELSIYKEDAAG